MSLYLNKQQNDSKLEKTDVSEYSYLITILDNCDIYFLNYM